MRDLPDTMPKGKGVHVRLCDTFMASQYLYRDLLGLIVVFNKVT